VDLIDELKTRIICGDGAMGTLLLDCGLPVRNVKRHAGAGFSSLDSSLMVENLLGQLTESRGTNEDKL
jgi:methionine synthase I (cobalamin-dependent)